MVPSSSRASPRRLRRAWWARVLAASLAASSGAPEAAPKEGAPPPGPPGGRSPDEPARCPVGERSAIEELSCELARRLGPLGEAVAVAVAPSVSDRPIARSVELSTRLARALAARLGGSARALESAPASVAEARVAAGVAKVLAFVSP